jgi:hypothetical protein
MRAFLRKLRAKFTDEISSHIVRWVIAGLVTGASGYAFLFERPRTWLLASHTINGPGWLLLVVLALPVVSICALGYLVIGSRLYKLWTYEDPVDVKNLLLKWVRKHPAPAVGAECTWRYDVIERELEIKPGSIRKCFHEVAKQTGLRIIKQGRTTVRVRFKPSRRDQHPRHREPPTQLM